MLGGDGSVPSGVMMVEVALHVLSYHDNPLFRLVIRGGYVVVRVIFLLQYGFIGF